MLKPWLVLAAATLLGVKTKVNFSSSPVLTRVVNGVLTGVPEKMVHQVAELVMLPCISLTYVVTVLDDPAYHGVSYPEPSGPRLVRSPSAQVSLTKMVSLA